MENHTEQSGIGLRQLLLRVRTLGLVLVLLTLSTSAVTGGTVGSNQMKSTQAIIVVFLDLAAASSDTECDPQLQAAAQLVDQAVGEHKIVVPVAFNVDEPCHRPSALHQLDRFRTRIESVGQSVTCDTDQPAVIAASDGISLYRVYSAAMKRHTEDQSPSIPAVILIVCSDHFEAEPGRHPAAYFGRAFSGSPDRQIHFLGSSYGLGVTDNPVVFTYPDLSDSSIAATENNISTTLYTWNHRLWFAFFGTLVSGSALATIVRVTRKHT